MTTGRRSIRDLIWQADSELNAGNLDAAFETLTIGISWYPNETRLYRLRAEVNRRMDLDDRAAEDEAQAVAAERRKAFKPGYQMARDIAARSTTNDSLFSFDGSLGRFDYFKHWLYSNGVIFGGTFFGVLLGRLGGFFAVIGVIVILASVVSGLWITLASATKRLRDDQPHQCFISLNIP